MKLSRSINWNLLHTFVVIAEQGSLSGAARVLGRGQPAVSSALKNLEAQVGCRLAERNQRGFELTEHGRILYEEAREICAAIDRIETQLDDTGGDLAGTVRLTIASHMTSPLIDDSLAAFHERNPAATFSVTVLPMPEINELLATGMIGFAIGPVTSRRESFDYLHIFREHCAFYCGPRHPLYGRKGLSLDDLEGEGAITYPSAVFSDDLQSISDMRRKAKFADPFVGVSTNMEEVRRMVLAGLGIGPIPQQVAERDVRDGLLWRLPPYEDVMQIDVYLVTNPRVQPSRTERAFLDVVRETVEVKSLAERTYGSDQQQN